MTIKTQNTVFSYAEMLKIKINFTVKTMFKQIKCEIMILQHKYSFIDEKEIKSAKIVKIINTKIKNNDKEKIITVRKLFSRDIVLTLNSVEVKTHMMKKTD